MRLDTYLTLLLEHNALVFTLIIVFLYFTLYPVLHINSEYIRRLSILARVYRALIFFSLRKKRIFEYERDLFKFKHELFNEEFIDYNSINGFKELYIELCFEQIKSRYDGSKKKDFDASEFVCVLEEKVIMKQLVFVEGQAGSGKSNFLRYLGNLIINKLCLFKDVIYVEAQELEAFFKEGDENLNTYEKFLKYAEAELCAAIHYCYRMRGIDFPYSQIQKRLKSKGKCLLLIDGLDEIRDDQVIHKIIETTRYYKGEIPGLVAVITGRPGSLPDNSNGSVHPDYHYIIIELGKDQIKEMIKKNYKYLYSKDESIGEYYEFARRIETNRALYDLAKTPFLLVLMMFIRKGENELPEHMDELIERFVELSITRRLANHQESVKNAFFNILGKISYDLVGRQLNKGDLYTQIENEINLLGNSEFDTVRKTMDFLRKSGLLVHESSDLKFIHRLIRDYLCADYIFEKTGGICSDIIKEEIILEKSDVVIFLCCKLKSATEIFVHMYDNKKFKQCINILAWCNLRNLNIDQSAVDAFWNLYEKSSNKQHKIKAKLYLLTTELQHGKPYAKKAITKDEYEYIVGEPIQSHFVRHDYVVGLDTTKINEFFEKFNEKFGDQRGEFKPVSEHYKLNVEDSDTVTLTLNGYQMARPDSDRFSMIKYKVEQEINAQWLPKINNLSTILRINYNPLIQTTLVTDIMKMFVPEVMLLNDDRVHKEEHEATYKHLRKMLIGEDTNKRDRLVNSGAISHTMIMGEMISQDEQEIFDSYFFYNSSGVDLDANKVNLLVNASMYRLILSLVMQENIEVYIYAKLAYLRAVITQMAIVDKLWLWGRMIMQYSPVDKMHYYEYDVPKEISGQTEKLASVENKNLDQVDS